MLVLHVAMPSPRSATCDSRPGNICLIQPPCVKLDCFMTCPSVRATLEPSSQSLATTGIADKLIIMVPCCQSVVDLFRVITTHAVIAVLDHGLSTRRQCRFRPRSHACEQKVKSEAAAAKAAAEAAKRTPASLLTGVVAPPQHWAPLADRSALLEMHWLPIDGALQGLRF